MKSNDVALTDAAVNTSANTVLTDVVAEVKSKADVIKLGFVFAARAKSVVVIGLTAIEV
jgi:hypothetical protein